jgi:class 3 adenylate cyclase/tetratricopeptide (TPR) repeat protein
MSNLQRHVPELALEWAADHPNELWKQIDGTLCFADISGFTALAERLAQRGRIGGEELVETLGGVFTTMLGIARDRGGMLLKFGGDALLLFFTGPDHAAQAASAAVEMRSALREAAKTPLSIGQLKLSMSVGLHSGETHFFLVGGSHRELVLLGPAANRIVEVESAANAGEIAVSDETAARLPEKATRKRDDGTRLLRWRKGLVGPEPKKNSSKDVEASARMLFPAELGEFLATGAPDPEHRVACISFIRFSGTDELLKSEGVDVLAGHLNTTISRIQTLLVAAGVTLLAVDLDHDGGKLFLAAGIPHAHEDDEGVMLRALRQIADLTLPLPLQIGVNRGHVFAAEVGDQQRAAFSAMGDTTNTAARITAKAPIGKILAHPSTLDECLTLFEVTPVEPLSLKGKAAPLVVYEVGAELGLREREGLDVDVLVGRKAELLKLQEATARLAAGTGGVLTLVGEAGLGKTRLLKEASREFEFTLELRAEPYGANSPYRMLRDPFRKLLGIERSDVTHMLAYLKAKIELIDSELLPMLALIGDITGIPVAASEDVLEIDAQFRPDRTADIIVQLLKSLRSEALAFVVDDAHWCDDATTQLLERIEHECVEQPWLMLVARRDIEQGYSPESGERLLIEPMPDQEIRRLVQIATEAAPLRSHEIDSVVQRAGGFPLFAEEIVRAVREVGSLEAVPESLEAAMAAQVSALDRPARRVLQYASVLGRSFSSELLAMLLASENRLLDDAQLDRLREYLHVKEDGRLQFRSAILRDSVYEGVAYRLRARLHQAAGEALEAREEDPARVAGTLAVHYYRAGNHRLTWKYALMAGALASAQFANADASRFYEMALERVRWLGEVDPAECQKAWSDLGEARMSAGMVEAALDAYRSALRFAGSEPTGRAEALFHLARVRNRAGRPSSALRDLTRSEKLLAGTTTADAQALVGEILSFRANVLFHLHGPRAALDEATRAVEVCHRAAPGAPLARSLAIREMARTMLEGPGDGEDLRMALKIYEQTGELVPQGTVLTNLGVLVAMNGQWQEAIEYLEAARDRYLRGGNTSEAALAANNLAELLLCQGHVDQAALLLADALLVVKAARWTEAICDIQVQMGHVLIERGSFEEANELLEEVSRQYLQIGQPGSAVDAQLVIAGCRILAGELEGGCQLMDNLLDELEGDPGMLEPKLALLRAIALAQAGDFEEAGELCRSGRRAAVRYGLRYEDGLLSQLALSLPGSNAGADVEELASAAQQLQTLGVASTPKAYCWSSVSDRKS